MSIVFDKIIDFILSGTIYEWLTVYKESIMANSMRFFEGKEHHIELGLMVQLVAISPIFIGGTEKHYVWE